MTNYLATALLVAILAFVITCGFKCYESYWETKWLKKDCKAEDDDPGEQWRKG